MKRYKATREWGSKSTRHSYVSRGKQKRRWSRYIVFISLFFAVFFFGRNFRLDKAPDIAATENVGLDIGGIPIESDTVKDVLSGSVLSIPLDDAIVLDEEIDKEANIAQDTTAFSVSTEAVEANLTPVGDSRGTGVTSAEYTNGLFEHVVVATLPDPPVGYYYEGWLVRSKPFDFISTGRLIQHSDDLKWYLLYEDKTDKRDYKKILVTLEPDDGDVAPADHVLEGKF